MNDNLVDAAINVQSIVGEGRVVLSIFFFKLRSLCFLL